MNHMKHTVLFFFVILLLLSACNRQNHQDFSGDQAYQFLQTLLVFGPRVPGAESHEKAATFIKNNLAGNGWSVASQDFQFDQTPLQNIVATKGNSDTLILIGTHYDSRAVADQDNQLENQDDPVLGANDGGSGTAVLLELSRILEIPENVEVWLVFFDGEDQGKLNGWTWSIGADYFVQQLQRAPSKVLIIDMIGDEDLNVYMEKNSTASLVEEVWNIAKDMDYQTAIIPEYKYAMLDDHLPFINIGYPAALLIDFDYPYWHTVGDTIEHVSAKSLQIIGDILVRWVSKQ